MICKPCRDSNHDDCPGGSWCDCQHAGSLQAVVTDSPLGSPGSEGLP